MKLTGRTITVVTAAFVLYLFANQTQVGWLYVMSAFLAGTVVASVLVNRASLRGLSASRTLGPGATWHEGDVASVTLALTNRAGSGRAQIELLEVCPLAAPEDAFASNRVFVPTLPSGTSVRFDYEVAVDRRGLHTFPRLKVRSRAPFGFAERQADLDVPTRVLVYPEVAPIARMELVDRRLAAALARATAGQGAEVLGVRPYRSGDSPRTIHWRSVARTGHLMSREFADEVQPGLTLLLDVQAKPYPATDSKHTPFEWAVKVAASIATYAVGRGYPLYLLADDEALAVPSGQQSLDTLYPYLARVQPTGTRPLADIIHGRPLQAVLVTVLPWPDAQLAGPLVRLRQRGVDVIAVVLAADSFTPTGPDAANLSDRLTRGGIDVVPVRFGLSLAEQLGGAQPARYERTP